MKELTPYQKKLVEKSAEIMTEASNKIGFTHSIMCQVGMPRKKFDGRDFTRKCGDASLSISAGLLKIHGEMRLQEVPYGAKPRLIFNNLVEQAVLTQSPELDLGNSLNEYLSRLGLSKSYGKRGVATSFKKQMRAFAACSMNIGFSRGGLDHTIRTQPISVFTDWVSEDEHQKALWNGHVRLSTDFFESIVEHAVPLDDRAIAVLSHSSLCLDIYQWLAHRLRRIPLDKDIFLNWETLQSQFGQEYQGEQAKKSFKKEFKKAMKQVLAVYPEANVYDVTGGIQLKHSPAPVRQQTVISFAKAKRHGLPLEGLATLKAHEALQELD